MPARGGCGFLLHLKEEVSAEVLMKKGTRRLAEAERSKISSSLHLQSAATLPVCTINTVEYVDATSLMRKLNWKSFEKYFSAGKNKVRVILLPTSSSTINSRNSILTQSKLSY
jgi:hypothetical protein